MRITLQTALGSKPQAAASRISHLPCSERTRSRFKDTSRLAVRGGCVVRRRLANRSGAAHRAAATERPADFGVTSRAILSTIEQWLMDRRRIEGLSICFATG